MNKIYQKNELTFSLMWIIVYVIGSSFIQNIFTQPIYLNVVTSIFHLLICIILYLWMKQHHLLRKFGLCLVDSSFRYIYFIPLIILASCNFWQPIQIPSFHLETFSFICSMIFVGLLEEILFRGLLYRALCKENEITAIFVSSITFGIGHIINLLNGANFILTLFQIIEACFIGLLFVVIYRKCGSIIPCIITHSCINTFSIFNTSNSTITNQTIICIIIIILCVTTLYFIKNIPSYLEKRIHEIKNYEYMFDQLLNAYQKEELDVSCNELKTYYENLNHYLITQWKSDYELDEAKLLPQDLKRGVLSQDALYNLLMDVKGIFYET